MKIDEAKIIWDSEPRVSTVPPEKIDETKIVWDDLPAIPYEPKKTFPQGAGEWKGNADDPLSFAPVANRSDFELLASHAENPDETRKRIALAYFFANEFKTAPNFVYGNMDRFLANFYGMETSVDQAYEHLTEKPDAFQKAAAVARGMGASFLRGLYRTGVNAGEFLLQGAVNMDAAENAAALALLPEEKQRQIEQGRREYREELQGVTRAENRRLIREQRRLIEEVNGVNDGPVARYVNAVCVEMIPAVAAFAAESAVLTPAGAIALGAVDQYAATGAELRMDHPELDERKADAVAAFSTGVSVLAQIVTMKLAGLAQNKILPVRTLAAFEKQGGAFVAQRIGTAAPKVGAIPGAVPGALPPGAAAFEFGGKTVVEHVTYAVDKSVLAYLKLWGINVAGGAALGAAEKLILNAVEIGAGIRPEEQRYDGVGMQALTRGAWGAFFSGRTMYQLSKYPSVRELRADTAYDYFEIKTPHERYQAANNVKLEARNVLARAENPGNPPAAASGKNPSGPAPKPPTPAEVAGARIIVDAADKYAAARESLARNLIRPPETSLPEKSPATPVGGSPETGISKPETVPEEPLQQRLEREAAEAEEVQRLGKALPHEPAKSRARLEELQAEFPGVNVEIVEKWSPGQLALIEADGRALASRIPSFYDIDTGTAFFNISQLRPSEVDAKFMHEAAAHHGIRELLGDRADEFYDAVYRDFGDHEIMDEIIRRYKLAEVDDYGDPALDNMTDARKREAADEFLAALAEESLKPEAKRAPWYSRVLTKLKLLLSRLFPNIHLTMRDLENILRAAARNLRRNRAHGHGEGVRFAIGQPPQGNQRPYYQVPFAEGLKRMVDPAQKSNRDPIFVCNTPEVFRQIGFTALPMMANARHTRLNYYTETEFKNIYGRIRNDEHAHGLHDALIHLPQALEHPLAVVINTAPNAKQGSVVAITDMNVNGKKIVVPVLIEATSSADNQYINSHLVLTVYDEKDWIGKFLAPALQAEKKGVGVFYFDKVKAARYNARSKVTGIIPTDIIHNINDPKSPVKGVFKKQTETLQFQRWFGQSVVKDANGDPLVVYHGTDAEYNIFDMDQSRSDMNIRGAFFSPWEDDAKGYGKNVRAFYLNIKNPADEATAYKALRMFQGQNEAGVKARDYLIQQGYDGVNFGDQEYVAFYPEQIKSATDNVGTFDPNNPDVRYSIDDGAGFVEPQPFDPASVDFSDMDARAVAVLKPLFFGNEEFEDEHIAEYLCERGFDVTDKEARKLAVEARHAVHAARGAEIQRNNARRRDEWLYDNVPLYRHAVDFGGKGFRIRLSSRVARPDDNGYFLAKKNDPAVNSEELAKYIARTENRPTEWKEIEEELADFFRSLKKSELNAKYHDAVRETSEGERELDRQAKEDYARYIEDQARDLIESGEAVSREMLEENRKLAAVLYNQLLGRAFTGRISNADIDDINAGLKLQSNNPRLIAQLNRAVRETVKAEYIEKMRDFRDKLRSENLDAQKLQREAVKLLREFIPPQYRGRYLDDLVRISGVASAAKRQVEFDKLCQKIASDAPATEGADLAARITKEKIYFELPKGERDRYLARLASIMKLATPEKRIAAFDALQQEVMAVADAVRKVKYLEKIQGRLKQLSPKVNRSRRIVGTRTIEAQAAIAEIAEAVRMSAADVENEIDELNARIDAAVNAGDGERAAELQARSAILSTYGDLAAKSGDEVYRAYDQLERLAINGRNQLLEQIAERKAGIRKIVDQAVLQITSGKGIAEGEEAKRLMNRQRESALSEIKKHSWGLGKLEDMIFVMSSHGTKVDWLETPLGRLYQRVHMQALAKQVAEMEFFEEREKLLGQILGVKHSWQIAARLQEFKQRREDWGITRLPASSRQLEYRYVTLDEAREMLAAYDMNGTSLLPVQAELLRAKLKDLDNGAKKTRLTEDSDPTTQEVYRAMDKESADGREQKLIGIPMLSFDGSPVAWGDNTAFEVLHEYLNFNQPDVRYKMQMNGWVGDSGEQLKKAVPRELLRYADWMLEKFREQGTRLSEVQKELYFAAFKPLRNYFPTLYDRSGVGIDQLPLDDKNAPHRPEGLRALGSLKERVAHLQEPRAADADAVFLEQWRRSNHYIHFAELARDLPAVLKHPDFKKACDQSYGPEWYRELEDTVNDVVNGGSSAKYKESLERIMGVGTRTRMSFNFVSGAKQIGSMFAQMNDMPVGAFWKNFFGAMRDFHEVYPVLLKSKYLEQRFKNGADMWAKMAFDSRNRYTVTERSIGKLGRMLHLDAGKLAAASQILDLTSYYGSVWQRGGDALPVLLGGAAVYRYHYDRMIKQGFTPEEAQEHALLRWEMSVDSLQQSSFFHTRNAWQRGSTLEKAFTRFRSAQMLNDQRVGRALVAQLFYGGDDWTLYHSYLDGRLRSGEMRAVSPDEYQKLVEFYQKFPLGESVVNKWGERLIFAPLDPDNTEAYIHHFAVKRKSDSQQEYFDSEYLDLFKKLPKSLENPDERLLNTTKEGIPRIVYVKKIPSKNGNHVMVVNVAPDGRLLNWTHMDSKDAYIENLREREREAVVKFGLVDERGKKLNIGYDEYMRKKADMRAYLAATQGPPGGDPQTEHTGDDSNIPRFGKLSSKFYTGAERESYIKQIVKGYLTNLLNNWLVELIGVGFGLLALGSCSEEDVENMLEKSIVRAVAGTGTSVFPIGGGAIQGAADAAVAKGTPWSKIGAFANKVFIGDDTANTVRQFERAFTVRDRRVAQEAWIDATLSAGQLIGAFIPVLEWMATPASAIKQGKRFYRMFDPAPKPRRSRRRR